eukprot:gene25872-biopygen11053
MSILLKAITASPTSLRVEMHILAERKFCISTLSFFQQLMVLPVGAKEIAPPGPCDAAPSPVMRHQDMLSSLSLRSIGKHARAESKKCTLQRFCCHYLLLFVTIPTWSHYRTPAPRRPIKVSQD